MRKLIRAKTGTAIGIKARPFAKGGEGSIYATEDSNLVAKIYHRSDSVPVAKLQVMIGRPPRGASASGGHVALAWPIDLLKSKSGNVVGYLMPRVEDALIAHELCVAKRRLARAPGFGWDYLHGTALNFACTMASVHAAGCVVGDLKTSNVLVNRRALVSLIDTDSFQVMDPVSGLIFPCPVGSEGFTPPELVGAKDLSRISRTEVHDRFGLAVIIYYLLFGSHPYSGSWVGPEEPLPLDKRVAMGDWTNRSGKRFQIGAGAIQMTAVHPSLRALFSRCLTDGHRQPQLRPSAREWAESLKVAVAELATCSKSSAHHVWRSGEDCPWCDLKSRTGVDLFLSAKSRRRSRERTCGRNRTAQDSCGSRSYGRRKLGSLRSGPPPPRLGLSLADLKNWISQVFRDLQASASNWP